MHGATRNTIFCLENLKRIYHSEDLGVEGRIILEWIVDKYGEKLWFGCIWLHKMGGIP
jgi:hypothetical protein